MGNSCDLGWFWMFILSLHMICVQIYIHNQMEHVALLGGSKLNLYHYVPTIYDVYMQICLFFIYTYIYIFKCLYPYMYVYMQIYIYIYGFFGAFGVRLGTFFIWQEKYMISIHLINSIYCILYIYIHIYLCPCVTGKPTDFRGHLILRQHEHLHYI